VEWQQARVGASIAHQSLQAAWRVLATLIGKPGMAVERLAGNLDAYPELNYDEQLAMALRDSPEIAVARKTVERQDATLTVERKAPIPDLQFSGTLAQNNELLESTGRPTGLMGGVQVGVQLPVFNRNQGKIDAAKAEIRQRNASAYNENMSAQEKKDAKDEKADKKKKEKKPKKPKKKDLTVRRTLLVSESHHAVSPPTWPPAAIAETRALLEQQQQQAGEAHDVIACPVDRPGIQAHGSEGHHMQ
jgi:hypothetical protein